MVVLDTDIVVALTRGDPAALAAYERYKEDFYITSFTWYELLLGICLTNDVHGKLQGLIERLGEARIILFDDTIATLAGGNVAHLRRIGRPTGIVDGFIAATCVINDQTLVTRNVKHFADIPRLRVETW